MENLRLLHSGPVMNPSRQMWSDSDIAGIQTEEEGRTWQADNVRLIYWSQLKRKRLSNPRVTEPKGVSGNLLIKAGGKYSPVSHVSVAWPQVWCFVKQKKGIVGAGVAAGQRNVKINWCSLTKHVGYSHLVIRRCMEVIPRLLSQWKTIF